MNNLSEYIIEKLKIDKDTKIKSAKVQNLEDNIFSYLKENDYYDFDKEDFEIEVDEKTSNVSLLLPKNFRYSSYIEKELIPNLKCIDWYSIDKDNNKIVFALE